MGILKNDFLVQPKGAIESVCAIENRTNIHISLPVTEALFESQFH